MCGDINSPVERPNDPRRLHRPRPPSRIHRLCRRRSNHISELRTEHVTMEGNQRSGLRRAAAYSVLMMTYALTINNHPRQHHPGREAERLPIYRYEWEWERRATWNTSSNCERIILQGSAKRLRPGCVNAAGKLRQAQAEVVSNNRNKIHQTWPKPFSQALW